MKKKFRPTFYILKEKSVKNSKIDQKYHDEKNKSKLSDETSEDIRKRDFHSKNLSLLKSLIVNEEKDSSYFSEQILEYDTKNNIKISHFETKKNLIRENLYKVAEIKKFELTQNLKNQISEKNFLKKNEKRKKPNDKNFLKLNIQKVKKVKNLKKKKSFDSSPEKFKPLLNKKSLIIASKSRSKNTFENQTKNLENKTENYLKKSEEKFHENSNQTNENFLQFEQKSFFEKNAFEERVSDIKQMAKEIKNDSFFYLNKNIVSFVNKKKKKSISILKRTSTSVSKILPDFHERSVSYKLSPNKKNLEISVKEANHSFFKNDLTQSEILKSSFLQKQKIKNQQNIPKINNKSRILDIRNKSVIEDRQEYLYHLHERKLIKKSSINHLQKEKSFEKEMRNCSFTPTINRKNEYNKNHGTIENRLLNWNESNLQKKERLKNDLEIQKVIKIENDKFLKKDVIQDDFHYLEKESVQKSLVKFLNRQKYSQKLKKSKKELEQKFKQLRSFLD